MALSPFWRKMAIKVIFTQVYIIQVWINTKIMCYISSQLVLIKPKSSKVRAIYQTLWYRTCEKVLTSRKVHQVSTNAYVVRQMTNEVIVK
ncbi:hypothetical protein Fmac_011441 [Flemingia macrophylla]|uniref:Secreted protein n=1 Tax=Flemingia macrophylla TaxID=520843 RepID=A0ABD1MPJ6_9FABA